MADWKIIYVPGGPATGVDAEIAEMQDCEPYNLSYIEIREIGCQIVWDDRNKLDYDPIALAKLFVAAPAMLEALKKATHELNAIRARDGAPQHIDWYRGRPLQTAGVDEEYFSQVVDECFAAISAAEGMDDGNR